MEPVTLSDRVNAVINPTADPSPDAASQANGLTDELAHESADDAGETDDTGKAAGANAQSSETIGIFGARKDTFSARYHLTRRGKLRRLAQIAQIANKFDVVHGLTPVKMRLMLEALGPTFVKVGQILSMRSEILPQSFCDELSKLRADADPMPYSTVLQVLEDEYGRPVDEIFDHTHPPSPPTRLAEVHRCETAHPARTWPSKCNVRACAKPWRRTCPSCAPSRESPPKPCAARRWWTCPAWSRNCGTPSNRKPTSSSKRAIWRNSNDSANATNTWTARSRTRNYAPNTWWSWTTWKASPSPIRTSCLQPATTLKEIGTKLVDNYATQVLDEGFFHADPHPGNIMVRGGQIVLLDLGMTGRLNAKNRSVLKDMIFAVAEQDSPKLADGLLRFAGAEADPEDYRHCWPIWT